MIYIDKKLVSKINREAEKAYPNEGCGVLLGEIDQSGKKKLRHIEPIINSREESEQYHRFLITPEDIMKAEKKARSLNLDVIGFYHSHPDCEAKPSDYDKEHALPFYSYVIVSVIQGKAEETLSWQLCANREKFMEENILK